MYIQQAFNYKHEFWRYFLGSSLIIIGVLLGQVPLAIAVIWKVGPAAAGMDQTELLQALDPEFVVVFDVADIRYWAWSHFAGGQAATRPEHQGSYNYAKKN